MKTIVHKPYPFPSFRFPSSFIPQMILGICFTLCLPPAHAQEIGVAGTLIGKSVGLNQNIVVVLCEYLNDETPFLDNTGTEIDSDDFAELMDDRLNPYFLAASTQPSTGQGVTSFNFIPIPGKCQFAYPDTFGRDDPEIMSRELMDAVIYADEASPGIFNTTDRIIFAVNARKRARATWITFPIWLPNSGLRMVAAAAVGLGEVAQADFRTIAHELGHELGLPDLYQLDGEPGRLMGRWGVMGNQAMQHFSSYSRYLARWIENPETRVRTITSFPGPTGLIRVDVPGNTNGNPELIRFDASPDESGLSGTSFAGYTPFIGYYVEARDTLQGLDTALANVGYNPGVVIYRHTDWLNTETGFAPRPLAVQHPSQTSPISNPESAAFQVGETFTDPALGLSIRVFSQNDDGSFNLLVTWNPPPRPDIVFTDLLLDSPVNGIGTTMYPTLFGDPVMDAVSVSVIPPAVTSTRPVHTMTLTVNNRGAATSPAGLTGSLVLLGPTVIAGFDPMDPTTYLSSSLATFPFALPALAPGQTTTLTFTFTPQNSFMALAYLDFNNAETDVGTLNNFYMEPFLDVPLLPFASPYPDLSYEMEVGNIDEKDHLIAFSMDMPSTAPELWEVEKIENPRIFLPKGDAGKFLVRFQPPSPDELKPRGQLGQVALTAWMDEGDSFVPIMNIPRYYRLTKTAGITLKCAGGSGKYALAGKLSQMIDKQAAYPLGNRQVQLVISDKEGEQQVFELTTNSQGIFTQSIPLPNAEGTYAAVAHFIGSEDFTSATSELCILEGEEPKPERPQRPVLGLKNLELFQRGKQYYLQIYLTARAGKAGVKLAPVSSNARLMKVGEVYIPPGKTSVVQPISVSTRYRGEVVSFKVSYKGVTKVASTKKGPVKNIPGRRTGNK